MNNSIFNIAVLIDGDNAQAKIIKEIIEEVSKYGKVTIRRIYGDWTTPQMNSWKDILNNYSINPIQKFNYTTGKNSTDSSLIIDAMDIMHSRGVQGFCIVSSDSDYTGLAKRIREEGLFVMGIGRKSTPIAFVNSCEIFTFTENLTPQNEIYSTKKIKAEAKSQEKEIAENKSQEKEKKTEKEKETEKEQEIGKGKSKSKGKSVSKTGNNSNSNSSIDNKNDNKTSTKSEINEKAQYIQSANNETIKDKADETNKPKVDENNWAHQVESNESLSNIQLDIRLIDKAFEISINEEEEAYISTVGTSLRKLDPSFDSRTYGFKTLTKLFESLDKYQVVKNVVNGLNHPLVKLK